MFAEGGTGYPDGACIDASGNLWNARWEGGRVVCYSPEGEITAEILVPARRVTCCAFGGEGLDTLYITTSRAHLTEEELAEQPQAGGLFACKPGVKGLPRPKFGL